MPLLLLFNFNSIKVQLEPYRFSIFILQSKFQFHKGTIRTAFNGEDNTDPIYFNSIKVQLELLILILL